MNKNKQSKLIFIIEDEKPLSEALVTRLKNVGFETETAVDGAEALEKLKTLTPDIILLDIILPKMDGFAVLEKIKEDVRIKDIPVIVLSNLGQDADIKRALGMGAVDYFVKTQHSLAEIVALIKTYL